MTKCMVFAIGASVVVTASAFAGDPVEWPVSAGGNGHWYRIDTARTWIDARDFAVAEGGHLVTLASAEEWAFVRAQLSSSGHPYWLGLFQDPPSGLPPASGWRWVTSEPFGFTDWALGEPNDWKGVQQWVGQTSQLGQWDDTTPNGVMEPIVEWSADCNSDGIVDFGQIRAGQLVDLNSDNIPDVCQCPTPHVVRVPQDAPSIAAAVALACPNNPLEIVLSPGTWTMSIDTDDPSRSITIRGLDQPTCIVTTPAAGTLLNARYGSPVRLRNLTVADLVPGTEPAQDLAWETYFDGCVVRNCTGSFLFDGGASPYPAAAATRFESCTGSPYGILYFNGSETIDGCDFVDCTRGLSVWVESTITNCNFTGTGVYAVQARASFAMSGCDFTNTAGPAIWCVQSAPISPAITVCHFTAGTDSAIVDTHFSPATDTAPAGGWNISSCGFHGNSAAGDGGAIRVGINRAVTLTNSEWIGNSTGGSGGAFAQAFGGYAQSLTASGCTFIGNTAVAGAGGALVLTGWQGAASISNTNFSGNQAVSGGAIRADRTSLGAVSCNFDDNDASEPGVEAGGAIFATFGSGAAAPENRIRLCNFRNNTGAGRGGAIAFYFYVSTGIEDCVFEGNSAGVLGGAISMNSNCTSLVQRCSFTGNTAPNAGTAICTIGAPNFTLARIDACKLSNQPTNASGARAIDAFMPIEMGGTSFCASGTDPYAGSITEYSPNCIALSCADENANGIVDECEGVLSALRVPVDYPTIQAAIDAVPLGQHREVLVLAGTYHEAFALNGKDVVVRGISLGATIIDGTGLGTAIVRFTGDEPSTAGVQDLVFRNGTSGALIYPRAPYTVGGALYAASSSAFVRRCEFRQNRADFGGAMYLYKSTTLIEDSLFTGNSADDEGGAVLTFETTVTVRGTDFVSNQCGTVNPGSGSGFKSVGARVAGQISLLENCSFAGGVAGVDGAAVEHYENTVSVRGVLRIVNTQISGNTTGVRAGGLRVIGRMLSCTVAAGTTICGNSNRNVDGPYFIEGGVTICDCMADVAADGSVNGGDLGLALNAWGLTNNQGSGDVNHDGLVNGEDLSIILSSWGACP